MERRKDIERARYDRQAEGAGEDADLAEWGARAIAPELRAPYLEFEQEAQRAAGEGPVLDIGAGTGLHSLAASRPGRTVIATDISRPALRVACRRAAAAGQTLHPVCADAEALPFRSSRFPLVTSAGSLYCLDFDAVCAEARRVLTPEGAWVLVDSYDRNPVYRLNRLLGYFMGRRTWLAVTNVPSARTIRRLREGFREVRVSFHGSFLFVAPLLHFALGTERTSRLLERADGWFGGRLREFAFKIVVVARGPRPNGGEQGRIVDDRFGRHAGGGAAALGRRPAADAGTGVARGTGGAQA